METIHLQRIGKVKAKPAGILMPGDVTIWNFGEKAIVREILKETKKTVTVNLDGWVRRFNKTRLVGVL